jgi:hypothetical protein
MLCDPYFSITPDIRSRRANFSHYRSIGEGEMMSSCKARRIFVW